ncbi:hypothetical protein Patl1_13960 [Pistacia atlantica]|uniref:Uncharacterized protein n=1 Tax=Pistacia atlantica TaxID=434234 RepID=A0ACC1AUT1_9ROSI|nr:hypothetical protein Patl1_13960 [Pistacia atlantica]
MATKPKEKRSRSDNDDKPAVCRKMPKRAATSSDYEDKSLCLTDKSSLIENKRKAVIEAETTAIILTAGQYDSQPNRRLTEFEVLKKRRKKVPNVRVLERVESWSISGYDEGSPVIWVSTEIADYCCVKPANNYKKLYNLFFEKAHASVQVYKALSRTCGANPDLTIDELLSRVVRSMSDSKNFPFGTSIKDFIISQGEFIYNQLIGLDKTSKPSDHLFKDLPVLSVLRDKNKKRGNIVAPKDSVSSSARLLQEEENWRSIKQKKTRQPVALSKKFYIKINEDEIASDYPLPAYYKPTVEETDEYIIFDSDINVFNADDLSQSVLQNWSLYNSDSRFISLELLPMKPCADIDVTIFGSGFMMTDEGTFHDVDTDQSTSAGVQDVDGVPIYLSAIKEWVVEFGSSMIIISVRTNMAWYRLGKPSKQYAPWYKPVLKTARLAVAIITLLKDQARASRLSFADVIKRVSEFNQNHPAYISSNPAAVERYVVVHGQIILQQLVEYPDATIRKCAFVTGLCNKMEERHHTKWFMKKKVELKKEANLNPRAEADGADVKEDDEVEEEQEENGEEDPEEVEEEHMQVDEKMEGSPSAVILTKSPSSDKDIKWDGELVGKMCSSEPLYKQAFVCGNLVAVGGSVLMEISDSAQLPPIYFVEYMFENSDARKMVHGRLMLRGSQTVLAKASDEREANAHNDMIDKERAEDRKSKGLPLEYYCKSLYWPDRGAFFRLPEDNMGLGSGVCHSCKIKETEAQKETFKLDFYGNSFTLNGSEYHVHDFVYLALHCFTAEDRERETFKGGRNVALQAYVVCQLLEIEVPKSKKLPSPESTKVKVRKVFMPEDISIEKAYYSDIREVYYSEQLLTVSVIGIEGQCQAVKKHDLPSLDSHVEHVFFCEDLYDPDKGTIKQKGWLIALLTERKKGKSKEGEPDDDIGKQTVDLHMGLATLDFFAGCGGLSDGLQRAGKCVSQTRWAIEYEEPAGETFQLNHPEALVFIKNCNVILRAIMSACGDADDCISTPEASELAAKLDEKEINNLPRPGQVEFINGGPPCQGFSGMNRFNQSPWSKVQCEMILAYLSFADYFRPGFFLLENVRNFVSFNKGQTFRLTLASLLKMGYQVRFGILEAGAYGVSQSRKRALIWAASPEETLPEWPEPMHVFAGPELKVKLSGNSQYAAVRSTATGAPFRSITVRDTIGDLPAVENGASVTTMEYTDEPVSWFQKKIRGDMLLLSDHISKEMNELNFIRLDWEGNFPTSITDPQPMGKVGMCFHPDQDRILTVRECARSQCQLVSEVIGIAIIECFLIFLFMQGFSDSYKFAGNIQHKHRQIGNAVPPPLSFALGRKLKEAVEKKHSTL